MKQKPSQQDSALRIGTDNGLAAAQRQKRVLNSADIMQRPSAASGVVVQRRIAASQDRTFEASRSIFDKPSRECAVGGLRSAVLNSRKLTIGLSAEVSPLKLTSTDAAWCVNVKLGALLRACSIAFRTELNPPIYAFRISANRP